MLNRLVEMSLNYKLLVIIGFAVIAALGVRAVLTVPIDAFPDVTPVQVSIYTESPGLAAEDVEQLLTFPVESALAGLPRVREIRSTSLFGVPTSTSDDRAAFAMGGFLGNALLLAMLTARPPS